MKMDGFKRVPVWSRLDLCGFTTVEEHKYYDEVLLRVINNPRFYLDNLDKLDVFDVSFLRKTVKKGKGL